MDAFLSLSLLHVIFFVSPLPSFSIRVKYHERVKALLPIGAFRETGETFHGHYIREVLLRFIRRLFDQFRVRYATMVKRIWMKEPQFFANIILHLISIDQGIPNWSQTSWINLQLLATKAIKQSGNKSCNFI